MKLFQGDNWIDHVALRRRASRRAVTTRCSAIARDHGPRSSRSGAASSTEIAKAGLPLHVHTNFEETIDAFLDQIEAVDKEYPIRNLRWALAHFNQPNASQLERMKRSACTRPCIRGR